LKTIAGDFKKKDKLNTIKKFVTKLGNTTENVAKVITNFAVLGDEVCDLIKIIKPSKGTEIKSHVDKVKNSANNLIKILPDKITALNALLTDLQKIIKSVQKIKGSLSKAKASS